MTSQLSSEPTWVCSNESLAEHCQQWVAQDAIALDTEFIRQITYYPRPGLIQLATTDAIYLIDPLAINQWQPFAALLQNPTVIKVIHACNEDLEVFKLLTDVLPTPLFDTQVAAAFANMGMMIGYQTLLKQILCVDIPKEETLSDWLQRPLSAAQIEYAALDVTYLLSLYDYFRSELGKTDKLKWLDDENRHIIESYDSVKPEDAWQEVGRANQLRPQQLAVLQALCLFRETEAREANLSRNRIIPKGALWNLARYQPRTLTALQHTPDMRFGAVQNYGEEIIAIIRQARTTPKDQCPAPLTKALSPAAQEQSDYVKAWLTERARQLDIPAELVLNSKFIMALMQSWIKTGEFTLSNTLTGWRRDMIGIPLVRQLNALNKA